MNLSDLADVRALMKELEATELPGSGASLDEGGCALFPCIGESTGGGCGMSGGAILKETRAAISMGIANDDGEVGWWAHLSDDEAMKLGMVLVALAAKRKREKGD